MGSGDTLLFIDSIINFNLKNMLGDLEDVMYDLMLGVIYWNWMVHRLLHVVKQVTIWSITESVMTSSLRNGHFHLTL